MYEMISISQNISTVLKYILSHVTSIQTCSPRARFIVRVKIRLGCKIINFIELTYDC